MAVIGMGPGLCELPRTRIPRNRVHKASRVPTRYGRSDQMRRLEECDHAGRGAVLRRMPDLPGDPQVARGGSLRGGASGRGRDGRCQHRRGGETPPVPGSPTIRIDGRDLFPVANRAGYALGCRMYATPDGLKGSPTAEMVRAALAERNLVPRVS
jgi:hypothetical protein